MPHLIDSDWTIDYLAGDQQTLQMLVTRNRDDYEHISGLMLL